MAKLRKMTIIDVDSVLFIEEMVCDFPWTNQIFTDCILVGYNCWVLEEEHQIVGYGIMSMSPFESHILNVAIVPTKRRLGLGFKILDHFIKLSKKNKLEQILLEVRKSNLSAINLYNKLGFEIIGERKDYYDVPHGREDALVYCLKLF